MTQFTGTLYPDKSFSLGAVPKKKKRAEDKRYDRSYRNQEPADANALIDWYVGTNSIEGKVCSMGEAPLFIKAPKSSRKPRGSYGSHGITGFGRKFVKNAALLLEQKYSKGRLGFITCTLPNFPRALQRRINGAWGEIVRRFYQKLKRQMQKIRQQFIYVGVTEIQEKRFKDSGVPVPHLHFVYVCSRNRYSRPYLFVCQIHRAWNTAVREGIRYCGYPFTMSQDIPWGSVHCQRVRKSASAYLGKYLSKGSKVLADMKEAGWTEFPRQWWTASMGVKKMYAESLIKLDSATCKAFMDCLAEYLHEGIITWASYVSAEIGGEERIVGMIGTLSAAAYRAIVS